MLTRSISPFHRRSPDHALDYFFRAGITYSRRSQIGFSARVLPEGCIFHDKGPGIFCNYDNLPIVLALVNSKVFRVLLQLQMAFGSYEIGVIQRTPVPNALETRAEVLGNLALRCVDVKRGFDTVNEVSRVFCLPALLQTNEETLGERLALRWDRISSSERQLADYQRKIDDVAFRLYGIEGADRHTIEASLSSKDGATGSGEDDGAPESEDAKEATAVLDGGTLVADLLSYAVGCVFGRWDARIALAPSLAPEARRSVRAAADLLAGDACRAGWATC